MDRLKAVLVLAIVLSLLVVTVGPVYAGKPGPDGDKSKKASAPGQVKEKKGGVKKQQKSQQELTDAPDADDAGGEKVTICHKPGTPAQQTLQVAKSALKAHLGHGDTEGACGDELPPPLPVPTDALTITVTLCHKPGTPAEKTLELPQAAVKGHLRHGDTLGPCPERPPAPIPVPSDILTVTLCHKPGTPAQKTLELPRAAAAGHLNHGDTLGACEDLPPVTWGIGLAGAAWLWPMPGFVWRGPLQVMLQ